MCRTLQFYLTIEQALLCGDPTLVENVTTPIDPALQPLLEMAHSWDSNGGCIQSHIHVLHLQCTMYIRILYTLHGLHCTEPNTVRFCGRKIQANPRFSLFLVTSVPLSAFPPTFTSIVCPLDFSLSQSWVRELLFRAACGVADSLKHFDKVCKIHCVCLSLQVCAYKCIHCGCSPCPAGV